ncbi:MAG: DNA-primase RepB domain-containing protein, partial [Gemmataceae bacterium]
MTYFDTLFEQDDLIELRLISTWEKDGKKRSSVKFTCLDKARNFTPEAVRDVAERCGNPRIPLNVYCGVCPRAGEGGKSADILLARNLWSDLDNIGPAEVVALLKRKKMPPPTLVVDSGHGTHLYWRLVEAVTFASDDERAVFEAVVAGVGKQIGGDHTHDLARLLRLPGTWNCKRFPWPRCEVQAHLSSPSARYPLDEFKKFGLLP